MTAAADPHDTVELDLLYSEIEDEVRATVRRLLDDRCDANAVLHRTESTEPVDRDLWRMLAELGFTGLLVSEDLGGAGPAPRECAVVLEELGRSVAPVPFLAAAVLAATALVAASDTDAARAALAGIVSGEQITTLAIPLTTAPGAAFPTTVVAAGGHLTGTVTSVVDLDVADLVIVPALVGGAPALFLVDLTGPGVTRVPVTNLDLTRRVGDLRLDDATATVIASGAAAGAALDQAVVTGAALLTSEQLGVAQWCLDTTLDYLKTRFQFARPIGSFQVLKHRIADVWVATTTTRAAARAAADALTRDDQRELALTTAVAQAYVSDATVVAAEAALQLHGGIGMTWEHPVHLYLKRAKAAQVTLGSPAQHRATVGRLVDLSL